MVERHGPVDQPSISDEGADAKDPDDAIKDLEPESREADAVKGGDFSITKTTDSASPKLY